MYFEKCANGSIIQKLAPIAPFDIEFVEPPTRSDSLSALAQVNASSPIAIAADQVAFTPEDVYNICRHQAADVIVLGLHEKGVSLGSVKPQPLPKRREKPMGLSIICGRRGKNFRTEA